MIDLHVRPATASPAVLFLAALALLGGVFGGCGSKPEPETAEVKKFRPADDDGAPAASGDVAAMNAARGRPAIDAAGDNNVASGSPSAANSADGVKVNPELGAILNQISRLSGQQP